MNVAVLGATGAVGRTMLGVLAQRKFAFDQLILLASARSAGSKLRCGDREYTVSAPSAECFRGIDVALFSAGAERSREWAPHAAGAGAIVIDNSSAWRMEPKVPLVVPEVNPAALDDAALGIVANPNCSTIQVVMALKPLHDAAGLKRVVLTTFQSVSGAGEGGRERLRREAGGDAAGESPFSRAIMGNVIPHIGSFDEDGWTEEEHKMIDEPRKILGLPDLHVAPTCVRVPVETGHSVQLAVELERDLPVDEAHRVLDAAPGIAVMTRAESFPTALETAGRDEVFVGRIRADPHLPRTLHLWVVADNLRKGAATNAVQIAELVATRANRGRGAIDANAGNR